VCVAAESVFAEGDPPGEGRYGRRTTDVSRAMCGRRADLKVRLYEDGPPEGGPYDGPYFVSSKTIWTFAFRRASAGAA